MKNFNIPSKHLTPTLAEAINMSEDGLYIVYGVFINNNSLSINKLHKGSFNDVKVSKSDDDDTSFYIVPVPEFIANEHDAEYAKYIQIHFIKKEDIKSDEEMMKEFVEAFAAKLSNVNDKEFNGDETEIREPV